jgi:BlaI family penicillinase repressor
MFMKLSQISDAEWEVMEVIWSRSPLTANEIIEGLRPRNSWAPTTIRTMLARLVDKKIVAIQKHEGSMSFRPLVSREECVHRESESFVERVFGGATNPLLLHFVKKADLSPEEIRELQKILKNKGKS